MSYKRLYASCIFAFYVRQSLIVVSSRNSEFPCRIFASNHRSVRETHLDWKAYLKTVIKLVKRK